MINLSFHPSIFFLLIVNFHSLKIEGLYPKTRFPTQTWIYCFIFSFCYYVIHKIVVGMNLFFVSSPHILSNSWLVILWSFKFLRSFQTYLKHWFSLDLCNLYFHILFSFKPSDIFVIVVWSQENIICCWGGLSMQIQLLESGNMPPTFKRYFLTLFWQFTFLWYFILHIYFF